MAFNLLSVAQHHDFLVFVLFKPISLWNGSGKCSTTETCIVSIPRSTGSWHNNWWCPLHGSWQLEEIKMGTLW